MMHPKPVRAKKFLGQHFLLSDEIPLKMISHIRNHLTNHVIEVGPGMGILTKPLQEVSPKLIVIEKDRESVVFLKQSFEGIEIVEGDFLRMDLSEWEDISIVGNFPYNISSQILFHGLEHVERVPFICGMFQKEMAQRACASEGSKTYGVLSVLLQMFYTTEYLFDVTPDHFDPPPKVMSGVICCHRRPEEEWPKDYKHVRLLVKQAFSMRRKKLSNALKPFLKDCEHQFWLEKKDLRAENLSREDFIHLTELWQSLPK